MTFEEFITSPAQPAKQTGTVFMDLLYAADKEHIANALAFGVDDPFGKPNVTKKVIDFTRRWW